MSLKVLQDGLAIMMYTFPSDYDDAQELINIKIGQRLLLHKSYWGNFYVYDTLGEMISINKQNLKYFTTWQEEEPKKNYDC